MAKRSFELSVRMGYTRGFGMLHAGVGLPSVAGNGLDVQLGASLRANERISVGLIAAYQQLVAERSLAVRGFTAGAAVTYHVAPSSGTDPWIQLGTGYRMLWESNSYPAPLLFTHGFDLAKLALGVDIRFAQNVALAPVVGADVNLFLWQDGSSASAIAGPRLNTFVFAGLQGRFDLHRRYP